MTLKEYLSTVPAGGLDDLKKELAEKCEVSRMVFYNWVNMRTRVPSHKQIIINAYLGIVLQYPWEGVPFRVEFRQS